MKNLHWRYNCSALLLEHVSIHGLSSNLSVVCIVHPLHVGPLHGTFWFMEFDVSQQHSCLASLVPELATWLAWWIREATKLFAARAGSLCRQVGHDGMTSLWVCSSGRWCALRSSWRWEDYEGWSNTLGTVTLLQYPTTSLQYNSKLTWWLKICLKHEHTKKLF